MYFSLLKYLHITLKQISIIRRQIARNASYFPVATPGIQNQNILYNLARRLRTIISEQHTLKIRMNELKSFLLKQKYPEMLIESGINRAINLDHNALRNVSEQTYEPVINYVSTHNPKNPELFNIIKSNLPILQEDPKMNEILSNFKLIKSKRQPNNLKRLLTKAKFNHNVDHEVKRCNRPNCGLCIHLLEGNSIE